MEAVGLSPEETQLYAVLIQLPRSTPAELATYLGSSAQKASRDLDRLVHRGLANRLPGSQPCYVAVAPDIALAPLISRQEDLLREARLEANALMEAYRSASRHTHPAELIEIITGVEHIRSRTQQLERSARVRIRGFDRPPYVDPAGSNFQEPNKLSEGVVYQVIYSGEAVVVQGRLAGDIRDSIRQGEQARVRPYLPLKLMIFDDRYALIPIKTSPFGIEAAFMVHPCDLFDALTALFESEWQQAVPLRSYRQADAPRKDGGQLDETAQQVLLCLAAGLTDEGIAHAQGWSLRTAQRHIQRLMRSLNATSRFQAGKAAGERGWI